MTLVWDQDIIPFRGIGPLLFRMTMAEVRALLGSPDNEFVRNPRFAPDRVEWIYGDGRGYVGFDGERLCDEIMLCPPANPRLQGVRLLGVPAAQAWAELRQLDASAFVDEAGCLTSRAYGVNVHAPDVGTEFEEPGEVALSVLLFSDPRDERLMGHVT